MTIASTRHEAVPPVGDDDRLDLIREELQRRGRNARIVRYSLVGDVDVRLEVGPPGYPAVELLGTCEGLPCRDRWQAVRITAEGRTVWAGPSHECPSGPVVGFVEDLLGQGDAQLTGRYRHLG